MEYITKTCPPWVAKKRGFQQGVAQAIDTIFLKEVEATRGYNQHRESVVIQNLDMVFDTCQKIDVKAEDYVMEKLKRMGYSVIDCRRYGEGHPDYIAIKGNVRVYVEVKSDDDGLRLSQAKWIVKNSDKKVILYWVHNVN